MLITSRGLWVIGQLWEFIILVAQGTQNVFPRTLVLLDTTLQKGLCHQVNLRDSANYTLIKIIWGIILKYRFLGPIPRGFDSVDIWWG